MKSYRPTDDVKCHVHNSIKMIQRPELESLHIYLNACSERENRNSDDYERLYAITYNL